MFLIQATASERRVTSPAKGDICPPGRSQNINWTGYEGPVVRIELWQSDSRLEIIEEATHNDGTYSWIVPDRNPAHDYYLMVVSTSDSNQYAFSEKFSIFNPQKIAIPAGSDIWSAGGSYDITWSGFTGSAVKIEMKKGESRYLTLKGTANNIGKYRWRINPSFFGRKYIVRVTSVSDPSQTAESEQFRIIQPRKVTLTGASKKDSEIYVGGLIWIGWQGFIGTSVKIDLYQDSKFYETITRRASNDDPQYQNEKYSSRWEVPRTILGSNFHVRITSYAEPSQIADSETFRLVSLQKVNSPKKGDRLEVNSTQTIKWDGFMGSNVKIDLYKGASLKNVKYKSHIKVSAFNKGICEWKIPDSLTGSDFRIKVINDKNSNVFAYSESFSIIRPMEVELLHTQPQATQQTQYQADKKEIERKPAILQKLEIESPIKVTRPRRGINWKPGSSYRIVWKGLTCSKVKIELLFHGTSRKIVVVRSTANDGSYAWKVLTNISGSDFRIKVTCLTDSTKVALSDPFNIRLTK
jgi:hypothetical protein